MRISDWSSDVCSSDLPPTVVAERIREILEVEMLPSDIQKIPDDIAVLMVAHPKNLSPRTLFAIDQYLLGGGKAAIFVDPLAESEAGAGGGPMGGASSSTDRKSTRVNSSH